MAENHAEGASTASTPQSAPSGLQMVGSQEDVGLCVDGYCVLPSAADEKPAG